MSFITFNNVEIKGLSAVVPKRIINNRDFTGLYSNKEIENIIKTTGISERRFADAEVCSSDLCYLAAEKLLDEMNIDRDSIDLLIFLSQTPDYHLPATAPLLQNRLNLSKNCGAFDINLACSGYVYGLSTAFAYASQKGINNVLLLVGETLSKITSEHDKATCLLFGDGGTATLIGKSENALPSYFSLNSDGSGSDVMKISGGGYRNKSSVETLKLKEHKDGSICSDEHLFMDGMEVFNFTMREVPKDIKNIIKFSKKRLDQIDYIIFHQANKFMTDFFAKKLKYPLNKVPYSLHKFGNTSSVSIPLTMVSEMRDSLQNQQVILSGYGAGLSWATAIIETGDIYISELGEM